MLRALHAIPVAAATILLLAGSATGRAWGSDPQNAPPAQSAAGPSEPESKQIESGSEVVSSSVGSYRGRVTEGRAGHPVAGAVLVFTNNLTSETFEATTDANGDYEVHLPPGDYLVDIRVGKKTYRSSGSFKQEGEGKWVMDFTVGTKLTKKDLKIETTPSDVRLSEIEAREPLPGSKKLIEFFVFVGGFLGIAALAN